MAESSPERRFTRIDRLPPYVFNITAELKMAARRRGEDIIDFSIILNFLISGYNSTHDMPSDT